MVETFAGHFQAQLTLLYVLEPFTYNDIPMDATAASERRLAEYLSEELKQFDVQRVLLEGNPAAEITEYARNGGFELVMLPTHGYGRFRRMILGSVTSEILRNALCPVWTGVHMEQVPKLEDIRFRKVVCAVDLGKQSCVTLRWASLFAAELGADLEIVHVVPGPDEHLTLQQDSTEEAMVKVKDLQALLGCGGRVSIVTDEVASGVCRYAASQEADLLVIGRSVHDGVLGRLRANAYSVIRQSPCPVVSV